MNNDMIHGALAAWGKTLERNRPDLCAAGSPERSLDRRVVEASAGELLLVERISEGARHQKGRMAELQAILGGQGLPVHGPLKSKEGHHHEKVEGHWFQVTPYIPGVPLDRPAYVGDGWRGEAVADFLISLREKESLCSDVMDGPGFDLPDYIEQLMVPVQKHHPKLFDALGEANRWLSERLFPKWDALPTALCHGDVHGVNVIWGEYWINAVIDWEFFGRKPELYDVANMVGCCGMENPSSLLTGLVPAMLERLKRASFASPESWDLFPELLVGLRYAWLSEWLRKEDAEMINLELSYIYLLMDNREKIGSAYAAI